MNMRKVNNLDTTMIQIGTSTLTTGIISTAVSADPLLTALIGFGVSLVTMVGGELLKLLVAYLKKKTKEISKEDNEKKEGN